MSITDFPTTSRHAILAALTVGWLGLGGAAGAARAEDSSDPPQVQISGYAEEVHPNDRAVVKLLIKVREADLEKTTTALVQRSAALMSALRDRGFGETMLTTTGPTSDEVWEITRNDKGFETERRKLGVDGSWGCGSHSRGSIGRRAASG